MPTSVKLNLQGIVLSGQLDDTPAGQAIAALLPLQWGGSRWGEEYYGNLDKEPAMVEGRGQTVMEVGDLAYHGPNGWFCLFFGPTPASSGPEPVAAVEVVKVGRLEGDWEAVRALGGAVSGVLEAS